MFQFGKEKMINYDFAGHINDYSLWSAVGKSSMTSEPDKLWGKRGLLGINLKSLSKFGNDFMQHTTMFAVIITTYNTGNIIGRAIKSVCNQIYPYFRLIIFDDASSDDTMPIVRDAMDKYKTCQQRALLLSVSRRFGQSFARQAAVQYVHDSEVVLFLDGDDSLASNHSLGQLQDIFHNKRRWPYNYSSGKYVKPLMTYGNFVRQTKDGISRKPFNVKYFPREVIERNSYRDHPWITHHPRVAVGRLVKSVPHSAVMDWNCSWLLMNSDLAQSMYMLEHSGGAHTRTNVTLYVYNYEQSTKSTNSFYRKENEQRYSEIGDWIRGKSVSPVSGKSIHDHIMNDECKDKADIDLKLVTSSSF
jgi:glycosyltransferase involved in cell wall biosynthesis